MRAYCAQPAETDRVKYESNENEKKYETYKFLFEIVKEKCLKLYCSRKLDSCKQNMKKTWDTIKEVIGTSKTFKNDIPKRMVIDGIDSIDQIELLMDLTIFLLKFVLNLNLQSQHLPKISSSS